MICPVCKTNNTESSGAEFCVQCGSDIHVHHLLSGMVKETQMKEEKIKELEEVPPQKKSDSLLHLFQIAAAMVFLTSVVFVIYMGMNFLKFMEHTEASRNSTLSYKWSETGFEQLQQMNATIKQELDLIVEQRRENQTLQKKVDELTEQLKHADVQKGQS